MVNARFQLRSPESAQEWQAYYHLRWQLLRAPWQQPEGSERDAAESQSIHVAAFGSNDADAIVGVGRLEIEAPGRGRIRFMAVSPPWQGQGIGAMILRYLETRASQLRVSVLYLHAREAAVDFYRKQGFTATGSGPTLFGCIKHQVMEKRL